MGVLDGSQDRDYRGFEPSSTRKYSVQPHDQSRPYICLHDHTRGRSVRPSFFDGKDRVLGRKSYGKKPYVQERSVGEVSGYRRESTSRIVSMLRVWV